MLQQHMERRAASRAASTSQRASLVVPHAAASAPVAISPPHQVPSPSSAWAIIKASAGLPSQYVEEGRHLLLHLDHMTGRLVEDEASKSKKVRFPALVFKGGAGEKLRQGRKGEVLPDVVVEGEVRDQILAPHGPQKLHKVVITRILYSAATSAALEQH